MKALSKEEMRKLDLEGIELLGIERLMESAGKGIAEIYDKEVGEKRVAVIAGKGNNGADGICAARYLKNKGYEVGILLIGEGNEEVKKQLSFDKFRIISKEEVKEFDAIIDGLFGYNFRGELKGEYKEIVELINSLNKRVLAIDLPSGIDADKGKVGIAVKAEITVCLCALKKGLLEEKAREYAGKIIVEDIGIPSWIYEKNNAEIWFGEVESFN